MHSISNQKHNKKKKWKKPLSKVRQHRQPIAVIGAGSWGISLSTLLARNGHPVRLWARNKNDIDQLNQARTSRYLPDSTIHNNITGYHDFNQALSDIDTIIIATPSKAFYSICKKILSHSHHPIRVAWGTKGIDPTTGELLHSVAQRLFPSNTPLAVLSGPSFAKEIMTDTPTAVSLAGSDDTFIQDLIYYFHSDKFRVYHNPDIVGVELCGVFKNVLAVGIGIADGLGLGYNAQAALITRGFAEMQKLCTALHADPTTLLSLAGLGDIVLTCTSNLSRNRRFGLCLGEGKTKEAAFKQVKQEVEGARNVSLVDAMGQQHLLDMPIVSAVKAIIEGTITPDAAVKKLMQRQPAPEKVSS